MHSTVFLYTPEREVIRVHLALINMCYFLLVCLKVTSPVAQQDALVTIKISFLDLGRIDEVT